jgi:DNA-binding transcriptional LysR family regulator
LLTQAGEQLLHHARKILNEMEAARASLQHLGKWGQGRLRIGASTTACQHILPSVLRQFKAEFQQMSLSIEPGDTPEAIHLLRSNSIDLALVLEPRFEGQFHFESLFSDEMLFIVAPTHPWAMQGHAIRAEIPRQQYILYNKASVTFQMVEQFFREEEMVLNTIMELGSMEAIKELVKLGLGVSVLAPWIAQRELEEKSLVALPLGRRKLKRVWGILHWKERRLSLAEERFVALCRAAADRLTVNPAGSVGSIKRSSGE